jgi:alkanesulfonate monooxygenase SsuD/methylene tetrahydromethanopterin reductase-like flavin-dependent oxidoreductase (luciferase family)
VPGPTAGLDKLLEAQHFYHEQLSLRGIDPASKPTPLTREVIIAETDERALEVAERHLMINYRQEYGTKGWKHPLIGGEDATPVDQFDAISRNRFLVGSPETVIKELKKFQDAFKVDHLICRLYFPGIPHDFIMQELKYLAEEVIPEFKA